MESPRTESFLELYVHKKAKFDFAKAHQDILTQGQSSQEQYWERARKSCIGEKVQQIQWEGKGTRERAKQERSFTINTNIEILKII